MCLTMGKGNTSKIWISLVGLPTPPTPTAPYYPSDLLRMDSFIIRITIYIKSNINTAQYFSSGPLRMDFLMIWALITANDGNGDISLPPYMNVAGNHQLVLIDNDATKITMIYSRSKKFSFFSLISRQKGCYLAIFYFLAKHLLNGWDSGRGNPKLFWRPRPNPTIWWQIRQLGLSGNPPTWFRTKTSNLVSQDVRS